jgi:hypothetical protein
MIEGVVVDEQMLTFIAVVTSASLSGIQELVATSTTDVCMPDVVAHGGYLKLVVLVVIPIVHVVVSCHHRSVQRLLLKLHNLISLEYGQGRRNALWIYSHAFLCFAINIQEDALWWRHLVQQLLAILPKLILRLILVIEAIALVLEISHLPVLNVIVIARDKTSKITHQTIT